MNISSKVDGYEINLQNSIVLMYINDKQTAKDIRETTPFTITSNNIKYLGVTLTR